MLPSLASPGAGAGRQLSIRVTLPCLRLDCKHSRFTPTRSVRHMAYRGGSSLAVVSSCHAVGQRESTDFKAGCKIRISRAVGGNHSMIRVVLPYHLRTLAQIGAEVSLDVQGVVTQRSVLD